MVTKNEHTGDLIQTKGAVSDAYKDGWDRIFGKGKSLSRGSKDVPNLGTTVPNSGTIEDAEHIKSTYS